MVTEIEKWKGEITKAANSRVHFEQQWYTNLQFYRGKQWVVWVPNRATQSGVSLVNPKSDRKRLVINRIMPAARRELVKLTKEEPQYFVQPNTTDQSDIAAARAGEAVAEYLAEACKFNAARRKSTWWSVQTGTGILKTTYDPKDTLPVGPQGEAVEGKVYYEGISPFHITVPYLELEDIEEQPWVSHSRAYDVKKIQDMYDVEVKPDTDVSSTNSESKFRNALNIRNNSVQQQAVVHELWVKPCVDYPNGALLIWANDTQLLAIDYPYKHREYPFSVIRHIPSGGFYGFSTIEGLIPLQKEYNLTRSQLAEARDLTSKPGWTAVKGSVDVRKLVAKPGLVIEYMPGADAPKPTRPPEVANYITTLLELTLKDFDDHAAQYEVTKGRTPPGVEAASAIAYLQEENDDMLYHTVASLEEAVAKSGRQSLELVQQYWDETRIINTVSKVHTQGAIEFKNSDLRNNTDLRVVPQSMAPRSRAAKQAQLTELIKMGLVPPHIALKYFGMSETDAMFDEIHVDINQARRENLRLMRGEFIPANEWDDHVIHEQEHKMFMKTQEYELLPEEIRELIQRHRQEHIIIEVAQTLKGNDGPGTVNRNDTESVSNGEQSAEPVGTDLGAV